MGMTMSAKVNGQTISLTVTTVVENGITYYVGTAQPNAPNDSTNSLAAGYYDVELTATDDAGNTTTIDSSDNSALKLYTEEKHAPKIESSGLKPSSSAFWTDLTIPFLFEFTASDNNNGQQTGFSGFDTSNDANLYTVTLSKTGGTSTTYTKATISNLLNNYSLANGTANAGGGYNTFTVTGSFKPLDDGEYTISIVAKDRDGNYSATKQVTFTVDTVAPSLSAYVNNIGTSPVNTNTNPIIVTGTTNDLNATVTITVEATGKTTQTQTPTIGQDGSFSQSFTLDGDGTYTVSVRVQDVAGLHTDATFTVYLDTAVPIFDEIIINNNETAECGTGYTIYVKAH